MPNDVMRLLRLLTVAAASCLACACASPPQAGSEARTAPVQVYTANPYVGKPYEVLEPAVGGVVANGSSFAHVSDAGTKPSPLCKRKRQS